MTWQNEWHVFPWRVRYHETDQMKVVYHTNYLNWFEIGRTECIRELLSLAYRDMEEMGILLPLRDVQCTFHKPAAYDQEVFIYTKVKSFSVYRLSFQSQVRGSHMESDTLVTGLTNHVWVGEDFKPLRIDRVFAELYDSLSSRFPNAKGD